MLKYLPFFFVILLLACNKGASHEMDEVDIDAYVQSCLDTNRIYEIVQGLRYSRDDESYQVTEYGQYDTVVLFNTHEVTETSTALINFFFKGGLPIYLEEFNYEYLSSYTKVTERRVYFTGSDVLKAYERRAEFEYEIDDQEFETVLMEINDYDFKRPKRAIEQEGEFELAYGEFLIINPESYLILENESSKYGVALYIMEGDMLLDELLTKPNDYRGKTIFAHHEFLTMNGVERMIYKGGIVKDNL